MELLAGITELLRKMLETIQVDLHLQNRATYYRKILHADLFLKILEEEKPLLPG